MKSGHRKLCSFIHYQRYLGLTDIDYSRDLESYVVNPSGCSYGTQLLVLGTMCFSLYITLTESCGFNVDMESKPGRSFYHLVLWTVPVTQLMLNIWFRIQQQSQRILLQKLSQLACSLRLNTLMVTRPHCLYRIWIGSSIFYALHLSIGFIYYWNLCPRQSFYIFCLLLSLMRTNYMITCYTSLVSLVLSLLKEQANQLEQTVTSPAPSVFLSMANLAENLQIHDELLLICNEDLFKTFGVVMLLNFLILVQNSIYFFYLSTLKKLFGVIETITLLTWMSLICLYMIMPLKDKSLVENVSISHTSCGLLIIDFRLYYKCIKTF